MQRARSPGCPSESGPDRSSLSWGWLSVRRRDHSDRGAAAVEFALVVPVLVLMLLGVVDYGIYFSDSLGVRQGLREGARQGVVENFPIGACTGAHTTTGDSDELNQLACRTLANMGVIGGQAFVHIEADNSWKEGNDLLVCAAVDEQALTGYTPLPDSGDMRAVFRMRIEQEDKGIDDEGEARTSGPPLPGGWSWCR